MLFFKPRGDVDPEYHEQFQVLCGIEEEFLLLGADGTLVEAADEIMVQAAETLERDDSLLESLKLKIRGLDAEPNPAQIEYVTLPLPPTALCDAVRAGRELLATAAAAVGAKILAQSLHPIQSNPHPIVGTHVNVSVQRVGSLMTPDHLQAVHNYLWNYLPELIAVSANSPLFRGESTALASNRLNQSTVLKPNGFAQVQQPDRGPALVPIHYYGRNRYQLKIGSGEDEFAKKVITNRRGDRLMDITPRGPSTNISNDKDDSPTRNRVEVRIIDVQQTCSDLLEIAYLCCASSLHAVALHGAGEILQDPYHGSNVERAIQHGNRARFLRDQHQTESVADSVQRWVEDTRPYCDYLDVVLERLPAEMVSRGPTQRDLEVKGDVDQLRRLRQRGKLLAVVRLQEPRVVSDRRGRKYKVPRNSQVHGRLTADFKLEMREEDHVVTEFESIQAEAVLEVQGLRIPLRAHDKVLKVMDESEYMVERLFGRTGF